MITATITDYSEYAVCVGTDESNYGSSCTRVQAIKIADTLDELITGEFPGINVRRTDEIGTPTPTTGPDLSVIEKVDSWVANNWTAAL
jgi:hypothetical protein